MEKIVSYMLHILGIMLWVNNTIKRHWNTHEGLYRDNKYTVEMQDNAVG